MLLFIIIANMNVESTLLFQYISCYCLSLPFLCICRILFQFQYISCYCLSFPVLFHQFYQDISIHLMLLFISCNKTPTASEASFQYISCYCLSSILYIVSACASSFQYISCYCLSNELTPFYIFLRI